MPAPTLSPRLTLVAVALLGGCGDNVFVCPSDSLEWETAACYSAGIFAARDSRDLVPSQDEVERYFDRWRRAIDAEPLLARGAPQVYRSSGPGHIALRTSNATVIAAWTQGYLETGDPSFDALIMSLREPKLFRPFDARDGGSGVYPFTLNVGSYVNEELLHARLQPTSSWLEPPYKAPRSDATWRWEGRPLGDAGTDADTATVDFTYAWGSDCLAGCSWFHDFRAIIPPTGPAIVYDLGGDPLDRPTSPNTRPPP